jgi:hypothetical protein
MIAMREAFASSLDKTQLLKYEVYERIKLKIIHEKMFGDETEPQIKNVIKGLLQEINHVVHYYKKYSASKLSIFEQVQDRQ